MILRGCIIWLFGLFSVLFNQGLAQTACGFNARATTEAQTIRSPATADGRYRNNENCVWTLTASPGLLVNLKIIQLRTESCCDYLQVTLSQQTILLRGHRSNVTFRGQRIRLQFITDGSFRRQGFTATYRAVSENAVLEPTTTLAPGAPCGFNANATSELQPLNSPGYPHNYGNDANCTWTITAQDGFLVQFTFYDFQTEGCCDTLHVRDASRGLILYQGSEGNRTTTSTTSVMMLNFLSDNSRTDVGFRGFFQEVPGLLILNTSTTATPARERCAFVLQANETIQTFASRGYPGNYRDNERCTWTILAPVGHLIILEIQTLSTEDCCDFLTIYNGTTNSMIADLSGEKSSLRYVIDSGYAELSFVTDEKINARGFLATYSSRLRNVGTTRTLEITTTPSGTGTKLKYSHIFILAALIFELLIFY
nr:CUB and sushi domain-containing protein 1-like [Ciona intestinalis]XP_026690631.1 CUB and sushi domain-containing protein 1-like [Ciona intestinalis]|eukprot:XP_018667767.1 CUB and sushi domain-containing protein 1-like [Ciona intestinalis]